MQMQQTFPLARPTLLRRTLLANALFSTICALACLFWSKPLATLLGVNEPLFLIDLGFAILLFAPVVAWIALRPQLNRRFVTTIFLLDAAWVVISIILLLTDWVAFTSAGKWLVGGVADVVALLAVLEYWGLRQTQLNG